MTLITQGANYDISSEVRFSYILSFSLRYFLFIALISLLHLNIIFFIIKIEVN